MRPFFIVGVKLIGLLVLYWALQHIGPLVSSVRLLWIEVPAGTAAAFDPVWNLIAFSVSFLLAVAFALFLLLRGERLAALVPLPEAPSAAPTLAPDDLLQVGLVVAGLLVACNAVPRFLLESYVAISSPSNQSSFGVLTVTSYGETRLIESGIQVVLSWFLVFRAARIAHLISRRAVGGQRRVGSTEPADQGEAPNHEPR